MRTAYPGQPPGPLAEIRALRETARLGLLPEAAKSLTGLLDRIETEQAVSAPEAAAFRAQLGLLNHMLAIAQKRGQVGSGGSAAGLEARATSQLGQDLWVLEQTGMKRGGYFVEFGATDGVLLSNTYLLETGIRLGWPLCRAQSRLLRAAEGEPQLHRLARLHRRRNGPRGRVRAGRRIRQHRRLRGLRHACRSACRLPRHRRGDHAHHPVARRLPQGPRRAPHHRLPVDRHRGQRIRDPRGLPLRGLGHPPDDGRAQPHARCATSCAR